MNGGRTESYRGLVIGARGLTKDYGDKRAVDDLTFSVEPGIVTGFLGPNGSGKSTTMRLILGLDAPTAGDVTVNGKVGDAAAAHGIALHELTPQQASLEDAFMSLTRTAVEFGSPADSETPEEAAA
jgi:ABC-type multidrug transport system ATPase subunit